LAIPLRVVLLLLIRMTMAGQRSHKDANIGDEKYDTMLFHENSNVGCKSFKKIDVS
jgi:hypothetical protein